MSHLQLVKSFNPSAYPLRITLATEIDPENNQLDKLNKDNFFYPEYKMQNFPIALREEVRNYLAKEGVDDYCMFEDGPKTYLHFRDIYSYHLATVHFIPSCPSYAIDEFFECSPHDSPRKIKKRMKRFQDTFDGDTTYKDVHFSMDPNRKLISAWTSDKRTLAHLMTVATILDNPRAAIASPSI